MLKQFFDTGRVSASGLTRVLDVEWHQLVWNCVVRGSSWFILHISSYCHCWCEPKVRRPRENISSMRGCFKRTFLSRAFLMSLALQKAVCWCLLKCKFLLGIQNRFVHREARRRLEETKLGWLVIYIGASGSLHSELSMKKCLSLCFHGVCGWQMRKTDWTKENRIEQNRQRIYRNILISKYKY